MRKRALLFFSVLIVSGCTAKAPEKQSQSPEAALQPSLSLNVSSILATSVNRHTYQASVQASRTLLARWAGGSVERPTSIEVIRLLTIASRPNKTEMWPRLHELEVKIHESWSKPASVPIAHEALRLILEKHLQAPHPDVALHEALGAVRLMTYIAWVDDDTSQLPKAREMFRESILAPIERWLERTGIDHFDAKDPLAREWRTRWVEGLAFAFATGSPPERSERVLSLLDRVVAREEQGRASELGRSVRSVLRGETPRSNKWQRLFARERTTSLPMAMDLMARLPGEGVGGMLEEKKGGHP